MSAKRYPEEFTIEVVKQVTDAGHKVADVAMRLGVTSRSLYAWVKRYGPNLAECQRTSSESEEIHRLKKELNRVMDERDLLKKAAAYFASPE